MTREILLNQIGFPKIAELPDENNLPGIGEKITLEGSSYKKGKFEVTEVKKDINTNKIYIYVNSMK
ncbi:MAG: hypothetical protein ACOCQW_02335 [Halanaerobiaceae bacterium]